MTCNPDVTKLAKAPFVGCNVQLSPSEITPALKTTPSFSLVYLHAENCTQMYLRTREQHLLSSIFFHSSFLFFFFLNGFLAFAAKTCNQSKRL